MNHWRSMHARVVAAAVLVLALLSTLSACGATTDSPTTSEPERDPYAGGAIEKVERTITIPDLSAEVTITYPDVVVWDMYGLHYGFEPIVDFEMAKGDKPIRFEVGWTQMYFTDEYSYSLSAPKDDDDKFTIAPGEKHRYEPSVVAVELPSDVTKAHLFFSISVTDESGNDIAIEGEYGRNNVEYSMHLRSRLPSE